MSISVNNIFAMKKNNTTFAKKKTACISLMLGALYFFNELGVSLVSNIIDNAESLHSPIFFQGSRNCFFIDVTSSWLVCWLVKKKSKKQSFL